MDLTGFCFYVDQQNISAPSQISVALVGSKAGGGPPVPFSFPISAANNGVMNLTGNAAPPLQNFVANGGQAYLDLAAYRAVTQNLPTFVATYPQRLDFTNQTGVPLYCTSFPRVVFMRYYPNGLQ